MRTTVNIDEALLREAKTVAARSGRSLGSVVEDALRIMLVEHTETAMRAQAFQLPTDGSGGLQPGVDLEDKEALSALVDDDGRFVSAHR